MDDLAVLAHERRKRERTIQSEVEQGSAHSLVFPCTAVREAIAVEFLHGCSVEFKPRNRPVVPPGDELADVEILRSHEELCSSTIAMNVKVAAVPSQRREIDEALESNSDGARFRLRVCRRRYLERARSALVLRSALDLVP